MKKIRSEATIVEGIRKHDTPILEEVYRSCLPMIEAFVLHHNGSREQARDVFQEAMFIAYRRIRDGELELSCKFSTYLYGICKKIWLQERKKYLLHAEKHRQQVLAVQEPEPEEDPLLQRQLRELFNKHFNQLSPDCRKILILFFDSMSVEEIQKAMNYKDIHHAADRKYRCKKSLVKRIINDPLFKRLKDETR